MTPRERNNIMRGSRTRGRALRRPKPPRIIPLTTQQKMGGFDLTRTTPKERNNIKGS